MHTFLLTLHVIAAVFLTGPVVVAPMRGLRALREQDAATLRSTGLTTNVYSLLSLVTLGLGVLTATRSDDYGLGTAWVTISMTLSLIAFALAMLVTAPALRGAAKVLTQRRETERATAVPAPPRTAEPREPENDAGDEPATEPATAPRPAPAVDDDGPQLRPGVDGKLQDYRGRIAAASGTTAILLVVVTVLMVTKPFG